MSNKLLLPNRYKKIGWFILVPASILGIILSFKGFHGDWISAPVFAIADDARDGSFGIGNYKYFSFTHTDITNTLVGTLFIIGAMLVSFSKEKTEDEFIAEIRLSSLLWAVCVSYVLLLIAFLFVYGTPFLNVMIYNMFTVLVIFIARFNYILYRNSKTVSDEK